MTPLRSGRRSVRLSLLAATFVLASCAGRCCRDESPDQSGAGANAASEELLACLDGERALGHIERLIALGPRHAGTPGAAKAREMIAGTLRGFGLEPRLDEFTARTPHPELGRVEMANVLVDIPGPGERIVMIGGHFDGKIIERGTFKGANDGGSSTAVLLEMARCLKEHPLPCPVRLVFFDGEEALVEWSDSDGLYGSKHMAAELKASGEHRSIAALVVVDMIGDRRLRIFRDPLSTPWVYAALRRSAERLGSETLMRGPRISIEDDHTPFQRVGIPSAVLIDLRFGPGYRSNAYWHTEQDDVDKLSPENMAAVGRIVLGALPALSSGPPPGG